MSWFKKKPKEEQSAPIYNYEEAINHICKRTGIDKSSVIEVLKAEEEYMVHIGIMEETCL